MPDNEDDLLVLAREANTSFVIPGGIERMLSPISSLMPLVSPYDAIADAFRSNIRSVIIAAGLPYMFALESAYRRRHQLLACAAELEAVINADDQRPAAPADADNRMRSIAGTTEGRASLNTEACSILLRACDNPDVREGALVLLLQALTLTWGAFEVAARDVFRAFLNSTPDAFARLAADVETKKRFELAKIPFQRLADFDFDVSGKLGELLIEQHDLADLGTIKSVASALFPKDQRLRTAIDHRELWVLFQQRHLIVHRRAIVDRKYIEATGDQRATGETLPIVPSDLTRSIDVVASAAAALLSSASGES